MSHPWWKAAPSLTEVPRPAETPLRPGVPWKEEAPKSPGRNRIKCSAPGCTIESGEIATASLGAGLKPFCEHHATGRDSGSRELFWKLPCACGRAAEGFARAAGGLLARHTESRCVERTIAAAPEGGTDEAASGRCACGKATDGAKREASGFSESHSARECSEQTTKAGFG
jgi:hypothetical protein